MNTEKIIQEEKPVENDISLLSLFKSLWHRAWIIILAAIIAAGLAYSVKNNPAEPLYRSGYTVYLSYEEEPVEYRGDKIVNIPEKKSVDDLMEIYRIIGLNRYVLLTSAREAGIDKGADDLRSMVNIELSEDTHIVKVTAEADDKDKLIKFVSALDRITLEELDKSVENSIVSKVEEISEPKDISSASNPMKYAVAAAFMAVFICCAVIVIKELAQDRVKSARELELRSGILVLSSVPNAAKLKKGRN